LKALTLLKSVASGRLFQIRRDCVGISERERCGAQTQQTYSVLGYLSCVAVLQHCLSSLLSASFHLRRHNLQVTTLVLPSLCPCPLCSVPASSWVEHPVRGGVRSKRPPPAKTAPTVASQNGPHSLPVSTVFSEPHTLHSIGPM